VKCSVIDGRANRIATTNETPPAPSAHVKRIAFKRGKRREKEVQEARADRK